jgi:outer membrane protein assembly factor BamE
MSQYLARVLLLGLVVSGISACSSMDFSNRTIHQGNLNISSLASKLHNGMSKKVVASIMGTSLISPMFNNNRWDYTQTSQKPRQDIVIKSLALYFKSNLLVKIKSS